MKQPAYYINGLLGNTPGMEDSNFHCHDLRRRMVAEQIVARGLREPRLLQAMLAVPRELFLPGVSLEDVYADRAQEIDCGQTISQPYMVALMTDALRLVGGERVLEIGTGSGYQAAVLSHVAGRVISVERHEPLALAATARLRTMGISNVECFVGDGTLGWPAAAPFAGILVAAGAANVPPALLEQLADGGRLVIPVGEAQEQMLRVYQRHGAKFAQTNLTPCRFVPLISDAEPAG